MESFPMAVWGTMEPCLEVSGGFQALIRKNKARPKAPYFTPPIPPIPPSSSHASNGTTGTTGDSAASISTPPKRPFRLFFSRSVGRRHQSRLKAPRALVLCSGGPFSLPKALPERSGSRLGALRLQDLRRLVGSVGQGVRWQIGIRSVGIWGKGVEHGQLLRCFQPT